MDGLQIWAANIRHCEGIANEYSIQDGFSPLPPSPGQIVISFYDSDTEDDDSDSDDGSSDLENSDVEDDNIQPSTTVPLPSI